MNFTNKQQKLFEDNMGLVGSVIKQHANGGRNCGCFEYDDLMQIGSIGLMKAVQLYQESKGKFSSFAYVLIRNEIMDALVKATRWQSREVFSDFADQSEDEEGEVFDIETVKDALLAAKAEMTPAAGRGIDALLMKADGYTCREIGEQYGVSDKIVTTWISRTRTHLKKNDKFMSVVEALIT